MIEYARSYWRDSEAGNDPDEGWDEPFEMVATAAEHALATGRIPSREETLRMDRAWISEVAMLMSIVMRAKPKDE